MNDPFIPNRPRLKLPGERREYFDPAELVRLAGKLLIIGLLVWAAVNLAAWMIAGWLYL